MAKYPVPGRVKTRLARVLGPERACELFRAFILDLADRLRPLPYRVTWAYSPPAAPFPRLVGGARCRAQRGRDLGARMAHALAAEFAERRQSVLVIGADTPHVPEATLAEAATMLCGRADLVLGPAADGGYYLIGLRAPAPSLFTGITWGTDGVLAATLERAGVRGLRTHLLPSSFDIDEVDDLVRLRALIAGGHVDLPRTALLLSGGCVAARS
ncbi:MAG TPA: TIGR04282 family arsenosugar biosynthesis glycosyltransferase [Candidatus Binatus sp.]|nr:TIGR04282 family arsenosugar biosynthesis glycosyltransferase [Candidatus Binatus sp.]